MQKQDIIEKITSVLSKKPLSINELSKETGINWLTAQKYLDILKSLGIVKEINNNHSRTFFYQESNNYFKLPIKKEDQDKIITIYHFIKKFCQDLFNKEPTRTQVYKIIWSISKSCNLNLPIGWYQHGPCCIQVYKGQEEKKAELSQELIDAIKKTVQNYCQFDNIALQQKIYGEEKEELYLLKEKLNELKNIDKETLNIYLMDLIKYVPNEAKEVTTDFARATLLMGWEKTANIFYALWKFIATLKFKQTLKEYYSYDLGEYFDEILADLKEDAGLQIKDIVTKKLNEFRENNPN